MRPKEVIKKSLHQQINDLFSKTSDSLQELTSGKVNVETLEYDVYLRLGKLRFDVKSALGKILDEDLAPLTAGDIQRDLEAERDEAAQKALEDHDFGSLIVTDQSSWERDGIYWSKTIYGDVKDTRVAVSIGIQFRPASAEVVETWCQPR